MLQTSSTPSATDRSLPCVASRTDAPVLRSAWPCCLAIYLLRGHGDGDGVKRVLQNVSWYLNMMGYKYWYCCIDSCPSRSDVTSGLLAGFPSHTVKRGRAAARPQDGQMCRYGNNFEVLVRVQVRAEFYTCCGLCTQHCRRNRASG